MKIPFFLLLIILSACTDIIQILDESTRNEILVVEGEITDKPGPYIVKLSTTTSLDGLGSNTLGRGARVIIEDDIGTEEILTEITPGVYQTNIGGIQGQIGRSYKVRVTLVDGEEYQSTFERMPEPVKIFSLNAKFVDERIKSSGVPRRRIGHMLSAQLVKEIGVQKYFQFKVEGIQESEIGYGECAAPIPPTPICYAITDPLQSQIAIFNDSEIAKVNYPLEITLITIEQKRRYLAKVETHSFSSDTYNFWSAVEDQLEAEGNIFASPIPPILGNVKNVNTKAFAQGNFTVASVSHDQICIDRSGISITTHIPTVCFGINCIQEWAPASYTMPDFSFCQ